MRCTDYARPFIAVLHEKSRTHQEVVQHSGSWTGLLLRGLLVGAFSWLSRERAWRWPIDGARNPQFLVQPPAAMTCPAGMVVIPAGTFQMGLPYPEGSENESPQHPVRLSGFCMDWSEVSVRSYRQCVAAGVCTHPDGGDHCNWKPDEPIQFDREFHPVNCVDWRQATAYCQWTGRRGGPGRLPTEAEWEFAARSSEARPSPSGDGCWGGIRWLFGTCHIGSFSADASPFGTIDMAGNVREWVTDAMATYYSSGDSMPLDPIWAPVDARTHVVRGGSWLSEEQALRRATQRAEYPSSSRVMDVGFRCVRGL